MATRRTSKACTLSSKSARPTTAELSQALSEFEDDQAVRGIIITGSDVAFSTGADLNEASKIQSPAAYLPYGRIFRNVTYQMEHGFKPIVAAISGHCYTGGLEIAMAADIRYAAENAKFAITSARIGSVAGIGGNAAPAPAGRAAGRDGTAALGPGL
jgi:enoyl-CoA hydratase/carnithine racemase